MSSRKEMIPAPVREVHKSLGFCAPEWDLLCRVRSMLIVLQSQTLRARDIRKKIVGIIRQMDDTFDDFPEDPK